VKRTGTEMLVYGRVHEGRNFGLLVITMDYCIYVESRVKNLIHWDI